MVQQAWDALGADEPPGKTQSRAAPTSDAELAARHRPDDVPADLVDLIDVLPPYLYHRLARHRFRTNKRLFSLVELGTLVDRATTAAETALAARLERALALRLAEHHALYSDLSADTLTLPLVPDIHPYGDVWV